MKNTTFYIDRQFGNQINIDVEDGIVQKCYNESEKFINRMTELYVGKPMQFLIDDIAIRFKGVVMNIHNDEVRVQLTKLVNYETKSRSYNTHINMLKNTINYTPEKKADGEKTLKDLIEEKDKIEDLIDMQTIIVQTIKDRINKEHNVLMI